jgi:hypothetical protein
MPSMSLGLRPLPGRRRIFTAVALSFLVHALLFLMPAPKPPENHPPGPKSDEPMIVQLEAPRAAPRASPPPSMQTPPTPQPVARPRTTPRPVRPPVVAPRHAVPTPAPPLPRPAPAAPPVDMLAMLDARRAQRRAAEAAAAPEGPESAPPPTSGSAQDPGLAALGRNLQNLSGDDSTGGVFQILRKSTLSGEFAFNGWRPDTHRRWREVIEVQAGADGNIDLAIVRRMIVLIRTHYTGDFLWESHRMGRVVTLSASPERNAELEEFMLREFFGTPLEKPHLDAAGKPRG